MTPSPDGITPVMGWRIWHPAEVPLEHPDLPGACTWGAKGMRNELWPFGIAHQATCPGLKHAKKIAAPVEGCLCGIHALSTLQRTVASFHPFGEYILVFGSVYLWGKVIRCERGYRAQFAYPESFLVVGYAPSEKHELIAAGLQANYHVPTEPCEWNDLLRLADLW